MHSLQLIRAIGLVTLLILVLTADIECKPQHSRESLYAIIHIKNAPYTVQLKNDQGKFLCAGVLISSQDVITAADCFNGVDFTKTVVIAGATTLKEDGIKSEIVKLTIHPQYDNKTSKANIAVLRLKKALQISDPGKNSIAAVALCEEAAKENDFLQVSGWRHMTKQYAVEEEFYTTRIPVTSKEKCLKEFNASADYGVFCAAGNDYDNQYCVSDLGGPAIKNAKVYGIVSKCSNCDEISYFNSFTDLYHFRDFVKEAIA